MQGDYRVHPGGAPAPRLPLLSEHAPHFGLLDPGSLDPSALLEATWQQTKRINMELQAAGGTRLDQFAELIAVPGPGIEQVSKVKHSRSRTKPLAAGRQ